MAISSRVVTVTDEPTRLDTATGATDSVSGSSIALYNNDAVTMYVGGDDVTTAIGVPVPAGTWGPAVDLDPGEALYAIVASGTAEGRVLEQGI